MGVLNVINRRTAHPITIHFTDDIVRLMQIRGGENPSLYHAVEVANDEKSLAAGLSGFCGRRCILGLPSTEILVQHIRVPIESNELDIREQLIPHNEKWCNAEIRTLCVTTTKIGAVGTQGIARQELLCLGIDRNVMMYYIDRIESVHAEVIAVTVPIYASIRAFDLIHRRSEDNATTTLLVDMDDTMSMVMISHGRDCVFANQFLTQKITETKKPELAPTGTNLLMPTLKADGSERQSSQPPSGLHEVEESEGAGEHYIANELERCLRHHDALFPDFAVDRVIFSGSGALDSDFCAAIATQLGIAGFIADPSSWVTGSTDTISNPAWTTVTGMCLRYKEKVA